MERKVIVQNINNEVYVCAEFEEIEELDWYMGMDDKPHQAIDGLHDAANAVGCKKIIATTDKSLERWPRPNLPLPPDNLIQKYRKEGVTDVIMVEYKYIYTTGSEIPLWVSVPKVTKDNRIITRPVDMRTFDNLQHEEEKNKDDDFTPDLNHRMDGISSSDFFDVIKKEWCVSEEQYKSFWNDVLAFAIKYHKEQKA